MSLTPTVNCFNYDMVPCLTQIREGTSTVTLAYDNADRRTKLTLPNTNSVTYVYNAASELTTLTYKKGTTVLGMITACGN